MRLPRDLSGNDSSCERHITIPRHGLLRVGAVAAVLAGVGYRIGLSSEAVVERLVA